MTISIRSRLLFGFVAIVLVVAITTFALLDRTLGDDLRGDLDARLHSQAIGVERWLDTAGHVDRLAPRLGAVVGARLTIVGANGVVQADSDRPADVGQIVGNAPEIAAAHAGRVGRATRPLVVDAGPSYLLAIRADDGRVIRLAVPTARLAATRRALRLRLGLASLVGLAVAVGLGLLVIRAIARPLRAMTVAAERVARGDYEIGPAATGGDELGVLSRALVGLADEVKAQVGALTRERDLSLAVIGAMVEGVIVVDGSGAVVLSNPAAAMLIDRDALPAPLAERLAAARAGGSVDAEIALRGRTVAISARPLAQTRGAVAVLHDVTRLRGLEALRREFLANAAHELRTPVTAIAGFAETLLDDDLAPAMRREFVTTIARNADRIARLVAGLLELERLDTRAQATGPRQAVPLAPVVDDAVRAAAAARPSAPPIAVELPDGVAVQGDRDRLEHVMQNLIDNAIKHGAPPLTVRAEVLGARVRVIVADGGLGLAPDELARIFERFYRGAGARRGDGSGLGLAIARSAAQAMGGALTAERAPGGGTRFILELDRADP